MIRSSLISLAILSSLASSLAGQVIVPGDASTLAEAVQLAAPGDRIFVRTLVPQAPVIIDKPLTIVGEPRLRIEIPCGQHAGLLLAGQGNGRVTVANADIVLAEECAFPDSGIAGGGFRELFLDDCTVDTRWNAFGGLSYGSPAVTVDVSLVTLHQTTISSGAPDTGTCMGPLPGDGHVGVLAPNADLVALHSSIFGGDGGLLCCEWCSCPPSLDDWGGAGGAAAIVAHAFLVESEVLGGQGSIADAYPGFVFDGNGVPCGVRPDGVGVDAISNTELEANLAGTGPMRIGERWSLSWPSPGDIAWVFGATRHAAPWVLGGPGSGGQGIVFLDPTSLFLQVVVPVQLGFGEYELNVPPIVDLIGTSLVFQVYDDQLGLTSPVYRIVGS